MADTMKGLKRTHYCTEVTTSDIGKEVVVAGFTQKQRDKGELVFIDLRDRTGIIQLTFDDKSDRDVIAKAKEVHMEYVLMAKGTVRRRESVNPDIPTGEIEVFVTDLRILAKAQTPPFHITDDTDTNEELRLRYRYLDLRRKSLQDNLYLSPIYGFSPRPRLRPFISPTTLTPTKNCGCGIDIWICVEKACRTT